MKKNTRIIVKAVFTIALVVCGVFLLAEKSYASSSIQINEIYPNVATEKGIDKTDEWVELYNPSDLSIDISGWKISDSTSTFRPFIGAKLEIPPHGFALISKTDQTWDKWERETLIKDPAVVFIELGGFIGMGLNNTGDCVYLADSSGNLIDSACWGPHDVSRGNSLEHKPNESVFHENLKPSPGTLWADKPEIATLEISEIVPAPANGTNYEFIEIHNFGDKEVPLQNWLFCDLKGSTSSYKITQDITLEPNGYKAFFRSETHLVFNDDGDGVQLFSPSGKMISEILYEKSSKGLSYSYDDQIWQWSEKLTPDAPNEIVITTPANPPTSAVPDDIGLPFSIALARQMPDETKILISGVVTVAPGTLSDQEFYLQDEQGGIQIYSYYKTFPTLHLGDKITVSGELSSSNGEKRLKIYSSESITIILQSTPVEPIETEASQIGENIEGQYIKISGTVAETSGDTFYLSDDNNKVKISIRDSTGIDKPAMKKGVSATVAGVVSQWRNDYRILPFRQEDVTIFTSGQAKRTTAKSSTLPKTGIAEINYFMISFFIFITPYLLSSLPRIRARGKLRRGS